MGLTTGNSVVLTGLAIELDIANPKSYAVFGGVKGYSLGGQSSTTNYATAEKITYSNDTTAAQTTANLSVAKQSATGCSEGNTKGYTLGGYVAGSSAYTTTTEKTFYSSDVTTTATSANSSVARSYQCSVSTYNNKGYICGGFTGAGVPLTTVDFIYFSNEVTSSQTTSVLTAARGGVASLSLPNVKGYVLGGSSAIGTVFFSTAERITYSTDAIAAQTSANLSIARTVAAGMSECSTKGYIAGGSTASPGAVGTVTDKLTFSTDVTAAQTTANLSLARSDMAYPSQGSSKGYFMGGFTNASSCIGVVTSDKITFTTDTTATQSSANISVARGLAASLDNIYSQTISDIAGGINNATINNFTTYTREAGGCLVFSSNVNSQNTATIAANSSYAFGTGDFTYEVWFNASNFASGNNYILDLGSNAGNLQYYLGRLAYYNATIGGSANLAIKGPSLVLNNWYHAIITRVSGTTYMYINGNLITSNADTHNYSAPAVTLGNYGGGGYYGWNGKIALFRLYSGKGFSSTEVLQNYNAAKNRFADPNPIVDSSLLLNLDSSNRLSFARYGGSKAYFSGGYDGASNNKTDKLVYSTDTTSALTSANTPTGHLAGAGLSDGYSKGYICGGYTSVATTDKLTYSTESCVATTTANLSSGRGYSSRISNYSTKGFVMGGWTGASVTTTDKVTYATDITTAVTSANQPIAAHNTAGQVTDGIAVGYDLGGYTSAAINTSRKITFSTEVTVNMPNTLTSQARWNPAGVSTFAGKGYISGGVTGAATVTTADKFFFATETMNTQSSANLSVARESGAGVSDGSSKGYMAGGAASGSGSTSTTDKITFNTDTTAAQSSANLSGNRYGMGGLDEIYAVSSTSWFDTTTNNNTSVLTNGPTYDLIQPAVIFDGTNDYGAFSASGLLNLGTAFTIEGFIKFNNLAQTVAPLFSAMDVNSGVQTKGFSFYYRSASEYGMGANCIRLQFGMAAWAWNVYASPAASIIDNGWHHIAVSCSAMNTASPTITFYVDGVKLPTTFWNAGSKAAINYSSNTDSLRVASLYYPASPGYDGPYYTNSNIANLKVFNRALNDLEILQDYNYYVNKLSILTFTIGQTQNNPAPSGYSIKQTNPNAATGWYWLNVNGITSQFWVDMTYDGGGWVLVLNNRAGNGAMPNVTYYNATKTNINSTGSYGLQNTPANFNLWAGLNAWKTIADETSGNNTVVMFVATAYRTLADINNHTKRARFTWTGWSATYAWQGAASYINEKGTTTAGLWAYHITNGYSLSTFDVDQDVWGNNCSTYYGNSPWWFGACWDGFYFPNGGGYADYVNWAGAGSDLHNYGAIYVR